MTRNAETPICGELISQMISIIRSRYSRWVRPPYGARTACESCKSIDVRQWHRDGCLAPGQHFSRSWSYYGGEPTDIDTINVATEADAVMLTYWTRRGRDATWKPVDQRVPITWTALSLRGSSSLVRLFRI